MNQLALIFDAPPLPARSFAACVPNQLYDGETFDPTIDHKRLRAQHQAVFDAMRDGQWHTLGAISLTTGAPQASVSARLRDFRKEKFGGRHVERRRLKALGGLFEYRLALAIKREECATP